jgi:2-phospho-L-lactate guanylyltransferase
MRALLDNTLERMAACSGVGRVTLVSSADEAAQIAADHGIEHFDDRGLPWNDALSAAILEAVEGDAVAIISADLPLLRTDELDQFVAALPERGAVIARATDAGTNAVAMRPSGAMRTTFGIAGSAAAHAQLAWADGLEPVVVDIVGLAFDLDTMHDMEEILRRAPQGPIRDILERAFV